MAVEIQVKIEDQGLKNLLAGLQERSSNLTPVMKTIGEIVHSSVIRNFEQERSPEGVKWKPSLRALLTGGKTLTLSAILKNTITAKAFPNRVVVATGPPSKAYAAAQQFGAKVGRGHKVNLPARPFLGVRDEDWPEIKQAVLDYLVRA